MPHSQSSRFGDDRIDEAIAVYMQRVEQGEAPDREQFLAEHADFADELKSFFADQSRFRNEAGGLVADATFAGETPRVVVNRPAADNDDTLVTHHQRESLGERFIVRSFGDYELLEEIARGGMGVVYKARQVSLNRIVAVKMILGGQLAGPEDVQRFHTEAEAAAQLDHPGIVPIYEVGEQDGQHYFSMGFVEGQSLAKRVAEGPLEPRVAAEIVKTIAEAVQYAHDKGVIHRDLKPGNILLDKNGKPRVTDFGLAKLTESGSDLTGTGQILGTPSYMPPEQASGETSSVGRLSDVYSLGAVLYAVLTGRPPFQAATPLETLRQVLEQDPVPPRLLNPSVPRDLETICLMCFRKEMNKRYASAADLRNDLMRFLAGEPIRARRVGAGERAQKWIKRRPAVAAMIAVTFVAIVGSVIVTAVIRSEAASDEAQTLVTAYLRAPAAAVPYAIKDLRPFRRFAVPLLRAKVNDSAADDTERFRAACVLADQGDQPLDFLLDAVPRLPVAECANLLSALELLNAVAVPELVHRANVAADSDAKARYAILAWHLGDASAAREALAPRADPIHRTSLIQTYGKWHGRLDGVAELLRSEADEAFRSGMCAAFGTVAPESTEIGELNAATMILQELYALAPDAGTHSAAGWALRQWKQTVPAIDPTPDAPAERRWFVNGQGMTMVEITPGEFEMGFSQAELDELSQAIPFVDYQTGFRKSAPRHVVRLTKGFYLGACEVTQQQFKALMGIEGSYYSAHGQGKAYVVDRDTREYPVEQVVWFDAVEFCNRLSDKEELPRYYQRQGATVTALGGIGYRLPTEAEWEFACRGGATTRWSFGDIRQDLEKHAWIRNNSGGIPHPVGGLCPNAYGLHDLYGNALEWCWDCYADYQSDLVSDPVGPRFGTQRVIRGGHFEHEWFGVNSGLRTGIPIVQPPAYGIWIGFRVAKSVDAAGAADARENPTLADQQTSGQEPQAMLAGYLASLADIEERARLNPADIEILNRLQTTYITIGNLQHQLGDFAAAQVSHQKSLPIAEKLAREHPANSRYQITLGGANCNLGNAQSGLGALDDALHSYNGAAGILNGVLQGETENALARRFLRNTCWGRAVVLGRLNRYDESAENWRQAIQLDNEQLIDLWLGYVESLARAGNHMVAAAGVGTLAGKAQLPAAHLYALARTLSLAAAAARDDSAQAAGYCSKAIELLDRARKEGWFLMDSRLVTMTQDADFDPLRQRDDFRSLVEELSQKPQALIVHAEAFARAGEHAKAADEFARAFALKPDDLQLGQIAANLTMFAKDSDAYRTLCVRLTDRFGTERNLSLILAWSLILAPESLPDMKPLIALSKKAIALNSGAPWGHTALAGAYLRNRDYALALRSLDEADRLGREWIARPLHDLMRALALGHLNRFDEARESLAKGVRFCDDRLKPRADAPFGDLSNGNWWDWYTLQIFRREAEELLRDVDSKSK